MIPGEVVIKNVEVEINAGYESKLITVKNKGDRPIQVGSHFHFFEVNKYLEFDRMEAFGFRLDIPSGTSVRFEPNEVKAVNIVEISGNKMVKGLNNITNSQINDDSFTKSISYAKLKGFI